MTSEPTSLPESQIAPLAAPSTIPVAHPNPIVPEIYKAAPHSGVLWAKRIVFGLAVVAILAAAAGYGAWSSWMRGGQIANGVFIAGEPVGGLTRSEAKQRLQVRFGKLALQVETPQRPFVLGVQRLGGQLNFDGSVDKAYRFGREGNLVTNVFGVWKARETNHSLPLPIRWNKPQLRRTMWTVANQYNRKPRNATLKMGASGIHVVPDSAGRKLNVGATLMTLQKKYYVGVSSIAATTLPLAPRITAASLDGVDVELGRYTTSFDSGLWGRTRNIHVAAESVDGKILMPGQSFSFNRATGKRTWDKGYRMAHIFERKPGKNESEVVDGLAGGVCQVSSTLFNAVRKSNKKIDRKIEIVERTTHSLPVPYVPRGLDATVAWPSKDLRFRNSFKYPIYLRAGVSGSRLKISVWGRVPSDMAAGIPGAKPKAAPERHAVNF